MISKISLCLINLTTEYGTVPAIPIERDTIVNITPHFFAAKRADEAIIPTIAEGKPRLIANIMFGVFSEGS